ENNYYPFGLKHQGYNEIANNNRSEAAEKYKYGGKEWNDELGLDLYDFHARNYDPAIGRWLNVDPLAEQFTGWTPYHYVHNNPINLIDPTGMSAEGLGDPPDEEATELPEILIIVNSADVTPKEQSLNLNQGSTYSNKLSSDFSKAYVNSGLKHGVDWFKDNVLIHGYNFWNNNSVVTGYDSGEYGPYRPDGMGFTITGSFFGTSFALSGATDEKNNFALFMSYSVGFGKSNNNKLINIGATYDIYDNYGPSNLFNGIEGDTNDYTGGYIIMGGYSVPIDPKSGLIDNEGVFKKSVGIG